VTAAVNHKVFHGRIWGFAAI